MQKMWVWSLVVNEVKVTQSCLTLCDPMDSPWNSPGQNAGVGSLSFLQGIFQTQGSNPSLLQCRWILCQLSHKGSPKILKWVAYLFFSRSSWSRNWTEVSCIAGGFFTKWAIRESLSIMPFKSNQVAANGNISFFLWLSSIPLRLVSS